MLPFVTIKNPTNNATLDNGSENNKNLNKVKCRTVEENRITLRIQRSLLLGRLRQKLTDLDHADHCALELIGKMLPRN